MTDLTQLEALARAATPGEWHVWGDTDITAVHVESTVAGDTYTIAVAEGWNGNGKANAAYIAAANPAAILALIERVRVAEADATDANTAFRTLAQSIETQTFKISGHRPTKPSFSTSSAADLNRILGDPRERFTVPTIPPLTCTEAIKWFQKIGCP